MKHALTIALLALGSVPLASCAGGPGMAYGPGPYEYDGWYDGAYGPIYDGYWGDDGYFYYRHQEGEGAFVRGDREHFSRQSPGAGNFQHMHGMTTPRQGVSAPHFPGGGGHGGGMHGGGGHEGH